MHPPQSFLVFLQATCNCPPLAHLVVHIVLHLIINPIGICALGIVFLFIIRCGSSMLPANSDNIIVASFCCYMFLWHQNLHLHGSVIGMHMKIYWHFKDIWCDGYFLKNEVHCYKEHLFLLLICICHSMLNLNFCNSFINDCAQNWHSILSLNPYRG